MGGVSPTAGDDVLIPDGIAVNCSVGRIFSVNSLTLGVTGDGATLYLSNVTQFRTAALSTSTGSSRVDLPGSTQQFIVTAAGSHVSGFFNVSLVPARSWCRATRSKDA